MAHVALSKRECIFGYQGKIERVYIQAKLECVYQPPNSIHLNRFGQEICVVKNGSSMDPNVSYFYLSEKQKYFLKQFRMEEIIPHLPCWIPHEIIQKILFSRSNQVQLATKHFGSYCWATEFSNVHTTFLFNEPHISIDGIEYAGTEQYYQSQKSFGNDDHELAVQRIALVDPLSAYQYGRQFSLRFDWNEVRKDVMKKCCIKKFQTTELKELLLDTGNRPLVQIKPSDQIWGTGRQGNGQNLLGIILQEIRDELRAEN